MPVWRTGVVHDINYTSGAKVLQVYQPIAITLRFKECEYLKWTFNNMLTWLLSSVQYRHKQYSRIFSFFVYFVPMCGFCAIFLTHVFSKTMGRWSYVRSLFHLFLAYCMSPAFSLVSRLLFKDVAFISLLS